MNPDYGACHHSSEVGSLRSKLSGLIYSLDLISKDLKSSSTKAALHAALHDDRELPDRSLLVLASQAIDILHETEQLLEPRSFVLADHFLGFVDSKCLVGAVELGVADALQERPLTLAELAERCSAHPHYLRQIMRVLYNKRISSFDHVTASYSNNSTSELLRRDHRAQWRNWVDLYGNELYEIAKGISKQVPAASTRIAGQHVFDTDGALFDYFVDKELLT